MVDDWRAAVEDLKDNLRHEIITLTNLARELTNIAYPIADVLEQHIKKVGAHLAADRRECYIFAPITSVWVEPMR